MCYCGITIADSGNNRQILTYSCVGYTLAVIGGKEMIMSKETKQKQKELEKQAQVNDILEKIEKDREAGNLAAAEDRRKEIRAAKEKLNEAYKAMMEMEKQRKESEKRNDPTTHTYSKEEKERILQSAKDVTARYMKLKEFTERYERFQKQREREELVKKAREQEQNAKAEAAEKKDEE